MKITLPPGVDPAQFGLSAGPVEEPYENVQHPGISVKERLLLKNVGVDPEARARALRDRGFEAKVVKNQVRVRKPGEKTWKGLEAYGKAEWADVGDIISDVTSALFTGGGAALGTTAGSLTGPGAVATGAAGAAGGAAAHEALKQVIAAKLGMGAKSLGQAAKQIGGEALMGAGAELGGRLVGHMGGRALKRLKQGKLIRRMGEKAQAPTRALGAMAQRVTSGPEINKAVQRSAQSLSNILKGTDDFGREIMEAAGKENIKGKVVEKLIGKLEQPYLTRDELLRVQQVLSPHIFEAMKKRVKWPIEKIINAAQAHRSTFKKVIGRRNPVEYDRFMDTIKRVRELIDVEHGQWDKLERLLEGARDIDSAVTKVLKIGQESFDTETKTALKKAAGEFKQQLKQYKQLKAAKPAPAPAAIRGLERGGRPVPQPKAPAPAAAPVPPSKEAFREAALGPIEQEFAPFMRAGAELRPAAGLAGKASEFLGGADIKALTALARKSAKPQSYFASLIGKVGPAQARALPYIGPGLAGVGVRFMGHLSPAMALSTTMAGGHLVGTAVRALGMRGGVRKAEQLLYKWLAQQGNTAIGRTIKKILKTRGVEAALMYAAIATQQQGR